MHCDVLYDRLILVLSLMNILLSLMENFDKSVYLFKLLFWINPSWMVWSLFSHTMQHLLTKNNMNTNKNSTRIIIVILNDFLFANSVEMPINIYCNCLHLRHFYNFKTRVLNFVFESIKQNWLHVLCPIQSIYLILLYLFRNFFIVKIVPSNLAKYNWHLGEIMKSIKHDLNITNLNS